MSRRKTLHKGDLIAENTAKAWLSYRGESGNEGIKDSYGVASVNDETTGTFSITLSNNATSGNQGGDHGNCWLFSSHNWSPDGLIAVIAYTSSYGSNNPWWNMQDGWVRVETMRTRDNNATVDGEWFSMACFGDNIYF